MAMAWHQHERLNSLHSASIERQHLYNNARCLDNRHDKRVASDKIRHRGAAVFITARGAGLSRAFVTLTPFGERGSALIRRTSFSMFFLSPFLCGAAITLRDGNNVASSIICDDLRDIVVCVAFFCHVRKDSAVHSTRTGMPLHKRGGILAGWT